MSVMLQGAANLSEKQDFIPYRVPARSLSSAERQATLLSDSDMTKSDKPIVLQTHSCTSAIVSSSTPRVPELRFVLGGNRPHIWEHIAEHGSTCTLSALRLLSCMARRMSLSNN